MSETELNPDQALTLLYREHHSWLLNWLNRRIDCRMQAEDHAHDTFMRIINANDAQIIRQPRAYLTTIAKSLLINHWRHAAIEQAYWDTMVNAPEVLAPSPEQHAIILATLQEIDALLDQLPEKVRDAFLMSQLDGLTYVEIGKRLGVSDRMIKKYMTRAMLHLLSADL